MSSVLTKDEIKSFLEQNLKVKDEELKSAICDYLLKSYRNDVQSWEQLRYVKQAADKVSRAMVKVAGKIISYKTKETMASFPKPSTTIKK